MNLTRWSVGFAVRRAHPCIAPRAAIGPVAAGQFLSEVNGSIRPREQSPIRQRFKIWIADADVVDGGDSLLTLSFENVPFYGRQSMVESMV